MQIKIAELTDIDEVLELQKKFHVDSIAEEDKKDGFVTTYFTKQQLTDLINEEEGLHIAKKDGQIVAYAMSGSWQFWSKWPMFAHMIKDLTNLEYIGEKINVNNSYQYGPVCVDKSVRGSGVLEEIFDFGREQMSKRYPILVTFINKINARSYEAHTRKLKLDIIQEFEYNSNHYYELAYDTSKRLLRR